MRESVGEGVERRKGTPSVGVLLPWAKPPPYSQIRTGRREELEASCVVGSQMLRVRQSSDSAVGVSLSFRSVSNVSCMQALGLGTGGRGVVVSFGTKGWGGAKRRQSRGGAA